MKAVQIKGYGGVEVIEINDNASKPTPSKNQVLIEVYAASINPVDWKIRAGFLKDMIPLQFPATLGGDFAGAASEIGDGVAEFKVGDEVYGQASVMHGGSFAEFAVANTASTAYKPKSVDFITVAALPLVGGETTDKSFQVLKQAGVIVSMLGQPNQELAQKYGVTAIGQGTNTNAQHLNRLTELVDSGKIKVHVDKIFPLEQAKEAFKYLEEAHPRGKVVLKIKD